MKNILTVLLTVCTLTVLSAQDSDFSRQGKVLVETGYNLVSGLGNGTGISVFTGQGSTLTSIGIDMGYFISEDFALKGKLGLLSGNGATLTNISAGGKYYIAGVAPLSFDLGVLTGGGDSVFLGGASVGYAAKLAPNVYLEPSGGLLYSDSSVLGTIKLTFALIL